MNKRCGKIVKCDQEGNITATFGADLLLEGSTSIPNILLKIYSSIGISDYQMMILIQLIRLHVEEKELFPSPEKLAESMESDPARIRKELAVLLEKDIITVSRFYDGTRNLIMEGYDFEPLFLRVSDIWAGLRAEEIEESEKLIKSTAAFEDNRNNRFDDQTIDLISLFENEFGRLLSPIEVEQIDQWASEMEPLLVVEALKRAVLGGKHNFKYINTILIEWKKNNIRTLDEISRYEQDFQKRRSRQKSTNGTNPGGASSNNASSNNDARKKAFIRTLYI
ncbi:MAG: DnaD domain protein [Desulfotomaculaceae bacterium]|nr:DnaD domain protein [Desulfotomaculaceae bacterium]